MRRVGRTWNASLLIATMAASTALAGDTRPAPLARYFPAKDLVAYVEFDGIDAHAESWKKTAASKILNETPAGAMLETVARQLFFIKLKVGESELPSFDDASAIARHLVRSGFAFGINRKPGDPSAKPSCIGLVIRGGARGPIDKLLAQLGPDLGVVAGIEGPRGRKISKFVAPGGPDVAWWKEGDDLAFCFMDVKYSEAMIAALEGREPNAVEHPARKELATASDGFDPVGLAFFDARALPELPPEALTFGLDGISRVDVRWGYRGEALESVARVVAPSPRKGVLAMFDQPTFDPRSLPPRPDGVGSFTAASIDLVKVLDQLKALLVQADPANSTLIEVGLESFRAQTGRRLREDILKRVGPRVLLADVPTQILVSTNPFDAMARGMARIPRVSLLVEIKDRAGLLGDLEALVKWANARFPIPKPPGAKGDKPAPLLVRRLKNVEVGYEVALSPTYWPLPAGYRPSIVVGEKFISLGTTPEVARQALRGEVAPDPSMSRALASLPGEMTLLSVVDTRNSALPELLANVPSILQWWAFAIQGVASLEVARVDRPQAAVAQAVPPTVAAPGPPTDAFEQVVPRTVVAPVPPPGAGQAQAPGAGVADLPRPAAPVAGGPDVMATTLGLPTLRFRLRLDPDELPTPEEIRPFLFPAAYSLSSDAQGFRFSTREAFPSFNPTSLAPLAISAALPMFQQWSESREKDRLSANLRQVGKALADYHDKVSTYPQPSITDRGGKPVLSWRVAILPFLGQQALFDEFHQDEPWDSTHNKTLIGRMPGAFAHPTAGAEPGFTFYRGLTGRGAFFDPDGIFSIAEVTDGTSNTLAVVEAKEAVPWTKPGTEIPFDDRSTPGLLGGHKPGFFAALLVDGSVRFIRESVNPLVFRSLATRAGGEVITGDSF